MKDKDVDLAILARRFEEEGKTLLNTCSSFHQVENQFQKKMKVIVNRNVAQ